MFEAALQVLVKETGAQLAIFCDEEGESIAFASVDLDPFDVRIFGAQHAALVLRLQAIALRSGQSERLSLTNDAERQVVLLEALPGGYYLAAAIPGDICWPAARERLRRLADRFAAEL